MTDLEQRVFDYLKARCGESATGETITKVDELKQALDTVSADIYPVIVALRNKGLIYTHKKGRLGMIVRILREEELHGEPAIRFCPCCGRKVLSQKHRYCYNCGESFGGIIK